MIKVGLLCLALHNMLKKLQQKGIVKVSCQEQHPVEHPTMSYPGPDILVFTGPPRPGSGASATNTVVMSNGQLDWNRPDTFTAMLDRQARMSHIPGQEKNTRSPCGSGTAAVMAAREARGTLKLGEEFLHDSILGTRFRGRLLRETMVGNRCILFCVLFLIWPPLLNSILPNLLINLKPNQVKTQQDGWKEMD